MCHQKILGFCKCGHTASILSICNRNGEIEFQPCPRGWSGELQRDDGYCVGCQSTFGLPGLSHNEILSSIKGRPKKLPFSYVVHGYIPRSAAEYADLLERDSMLILWPPDHDGRPVEWLSLPPPPPWERQQTNCDSNETGFQTNHEINSPPSSFKSNSGSALGRHTNQVKPKKHVQFFEESHVQFFFKDENTNCVKSHSTGMNEYCVVEEVIWGPKPPPHWNDPAKLSQQ